MKNLFKTYIGVACLMVGISSCSDDFLKEKKDYNNMTTVDVYSDKGQATAVLAKLYKQCFETYNSPLCGADPIMRHDKNTGGQQAKFSEEMTGWKGSYYDGSVQKQVITFPILLIGMLPVLIRKTIIILIKRPFIPLFMLLITLFRR